LEAISGMATTRAVGVTHPAARGARGTARAAEFFQSGGGCGGLRRIGRGAVAGAVV